MSKKLVALRITDETARQLEELMERMGAGKTNVLVYALDRLYREVVEGTPRQEQDPPKLGNK